jgi:hypothetical protein
MLKKWQKKENKDAKDFGGNKQRSSGMLWHSPSDVLTPIFSIDSKFTEKSSYSISKSTWDKLCEEAAWNKERIPLLSVKIKNLELCVISKEDLLSLMKKIN